MNHRGTEDKEPKLGGTEQRYALTERVIGAAIEVHRDLGPGYMEAIYEQALAIELAERAIPFARQVALPLVYKGRPIGHGRVDFLVADVLVVELKAVDAILPVHIAQALSYLKAGPFGIALLINFKVALLRDGIRRVVL